VASRFDVFEGAGVAFAQASDLFVDEGRVLEFACGDALAQFAQVLDGGGFGAAAHGAFFLAASGAAA